MTHAEDRSGIGTVRLVALKLVLNTAVRLVYPFLPAIARGLGIGMGQAGVLVSVRWVAGFASPVVLALAGRRATSRALLLVGLAVFSVGAFVTAWMGMYAGALIGFALIGFAKPLFDVGCQAHVAERVPWARRSRHIGLLELSWAGGLLIGAPAAGWLIERGSWNTPFVVLGGLAALGMLAVAMLGEADASVPAQVPTGVRLNPAARLFLVMTGFIGFTLELLLVNLGTWLESSFALTLLALGGVGTVLGVGELLGEGGVVAITDRVDKRRALVVALVGAATAFATLALMTESLMAGVAALAVGTALVEYTIVSGMSVATELHPTNRTGYLAWFAVAMSVGRIAADLLGPWLFSGGGMPATAAAASASAVAAAAFATRLPSLEASRSRTQT